MAGDRPEFPPNRVIREGDLSCDRATRANPDNERVQQTETRLYLLRHDDEFWYIEAATMPEAIAVWHASVQIEWDYEYDPEDEPDSCALIHIGYPAVYRRGVTIEGTRGETVTDVNALAGQVLDLCNAHNAGPQGDYVIDETVRPKLIELLMRAMLGDSTHPAQHASAKIDDKCADCQIDGEPCLRCYEVWWRTRHPNVTLVNMPPRTALDVLGVHDAGDEAENTTDNPTSWKAWKRRAEVAEAKLAARSESLTDALGVKD